jgi:methyl-accepting chemotaxis protein
MNIKLPVLRFTLQIKLIISFVIIFLLFCVLWYTSQNALETGEKAVNAVLETNELVRLSKQGNINLAKAGQLPKVVESANNGLNEIAVEMLQLQEEFGQISEKIERMNNTGTTAELADNFIKVGNDFYNAMGKFIPIREKMLTYTTEYKGQNRPLPDVLCERELGHIRFIRSLGDSIKKNKRLTGGMDFRECGFYQWYVSNPSKDEDIAEVFEEIDPLHRKLHNYAAEIDKSLAASDQDQANNILKAAQKDLGLLGLYFTGVRNLGAEKYSESQEEFQKQLLDLEEIYNDAVISVNSMEEHLQKEMNTSIKQMDITNGENRSMTFGFSLAGLVLTFMIATYAIWMLSHSVKIFRNMMDGLTYSARTFNEMSERLSDNSSNTLNLAGNASDAMEKTAANIDAVAAAVEEMNASIQEISNSSISSAEIAGEAVEQAKNTVTMANEQRQNAEGIGSVSDMIRSIAFKINLLALNANVEAARAGEAGRGFAVVAAEVKNLASATAEATDSITEKIASLQEGSHKSAEAMSTIGKVISKVSENSSSIAASVEEQSAITTDISNNISGVVHSSQEAAGDIHNVSEAADDTNQRCEGMLNEAAKLTEYAEELNMLLEKF